MTQRSLEDVRPFLGADAIVVGRGDAVFANVRPIESADERSLAWISPKRTAQAVEILRATSAAIVIAPKDVVVPDDVAARTCVVLVPSPRLVFARIANALFVTGEARRGVHPSAIVDPEASIDPGAWIGPFCRIGRARIGAGCVLEGHVDIGDGAVLGERVWIAPFTVVGVAGFGYTADERGEWVHFPHVGATIVGDDVRIGAHCCIVRASLGETVVGRGTKLDNYVTVGHNARVGERVLIATHSVIGGSATVGDDVWISPHVTILNSLTIGSGAVIGAAACVVADVPEGAKLVGTPARTMPQAMWKLRRPQA